MSFSKDSLVRITEMRLREFAERMAERRVKLTYPDTFPAYICDFVSEGHGVNANAINWVIKKKIEPVVAEALVSVGDSPCTLRLSGSKGGVKSRLYMKKVRESCQ
jgi:ATP-dependent Clp protease ATP-binding subunit ClpA